jgi:hypothetical protein
MKTFSAAAIFTTLVSGASASFDYAANPTGSEKCALINVAMDESGSMGSDQTFMRNKALPRMGRTLHAAPYGYDYVFVCSGGFGSYSNSNGNYYHSMGCTTLDSNGNLANNDVTDWVASGATEDGWAAMQRSMNDVSETIEGMNLISTCGRIDKNMILVTDEDRDDTNSQLTASGVKQDIANKGYILNVIVDVTIDGSDDNFGMKIGGGGYQTEIFRMDTSLPSDYRTFNKTGNYRTFSNGWVDTHDHYSDLVVDTGGAVWNIKAVRSGGQLTDVFADVFVIIKAEELDNACVTQCGGSSSGGGDPHITTWHNEHYEYHGQCDLVMMNDPDFAGGLGLDVHIRTKIVRYWSYIRNVGIKIGNDILEIEGSADADDAEAHYWYNFEYQGELETVGGFPVTQSLPSPYKRKYKIDLSSKFGPKTHIIVQLYKEFVRVTFNGPHDDVFGKTVGLLGDYNTGKTFARDGTTVINDFTELGDEWQVLPSEPKLFHELSHPQFPELCIKPEDPRGERKRRLDESSISVEQAEEACATLKDPLSIKDCVYDILATQDLDMVGAF